MKVAFITKSVDMVKIEAMGCIVQAKSANSICPWLDVLNANIGYIGQIAKLVLAKYIIFAQLEMIFAVSEKGGIHDGYRR